MLNSNENKNKNNNCSQSINESSEGNTPPKIKPIWYEKPRQKSHQTVDIKAFREKLKKGNCIKSFGDSTRYDIEGHLITKGGNQRIKFADEITDERKQSLATTHYVESYKRYNAPSWFEKWWTIF